MTALAAAYVAVWLGVCCYLARLAVKQQRLTRLVESLRSRVESADGELESVDMR